MTVKLSLCMIIKNEEEYLPACLESVRHVADEIIIVDTGSTDSSRNKALQFGARVIDHEWQNDFSRARNLSIENACGDWILVLDADEELESGSGDKIRKLIECTDGDGFELTVESEMPETDIIAFDRIKILRLFRNKKEFRYALPIHEQIRPSIEKSGGKILDSELVILHHGYARKTVQGGVNRAARNLDLLQIGLSISPNDPYLIYQVGATLMSAGKHVEAQAELRRVLEMEYSKLPTVILDKLFMKLSQLALEMNDNKMAVKFAEDSLQYNPSNTISKYVLAIALLSAERIADGYQILLTIQAGRDLNIRLGKQLDHLLTACRTVLGPG